MPATTATASLQGAEHPSPSGGVEPSLVLPAAAAASVRQRPQQQLPWQQRSVQQWSRQARALELLAEHAPAPDLRTISRVRRLTSGLTRLVTPPCNPVLVIRCL